MSTNKTEKYHLHAWEPGDDFLLSEINENFAALDGAARVVTGSYTGSGAAEREISLGFAPAAVLLCDNKGNTSYLSGQFVACGGLFLPGCPIDGVPGGTAAEMTATGFRLLQGDFRQTNAKNTRYHYLALR